MKKSMLATVLLLVLAVFVIGAVLFIGGCGSDDDSPGAAAPTAKRTLASAFRTNTDYTFIHGTNNPAGDELYVALNNTTAGQGGTTAGMNGSFTAYRLKMSDVVAGTVSSSSIITSATITGMSTGAATIAFRQSYTPDGTKIVQAGKDRVVVLNGTTLAALNGASGDTNIGGGSAWFENHDVLTVDNNYAIIAIMSNTTATSVGAVEKFVLYDLNANAAIGTAVNACSTCHDAGEAKSHVACGIDGTFTKGTGSTYSGTVYASSTTGGHIVKIPVTINVAATTPITVGTQATVQISASGPPASSDIPNFHDVRLDSAAGRVYYSAIAREASTGRTHMGYVETANFTTSGKHDATISTAAASGQIVYCGSGQTTDYFIPQTMSYPAYIDAVPKSLITTGAAINP